MKKKNGGKKEKKLRYLINEGFDRIPFAPCHLHSISFPLKQICQPCRFNSITHFPPQHRDPFISRDGSIKSRLNVKSNPFALN